MSTAPAHYRRSYSNLERWLRDVEKGIRMAQEDGRIHTPYGAQLIRTRDQLRRDLGKTGDQS